MQEVRSSFNFTPLSCTKAFSCMSVLKFSAKIFCSISTRGWQVVFKWYLTFCFLFLLQYEPFALFISPYSKCALIIEWLTSSWSFHWFSSLYSVCFTHMNVFTFIALVVKVIQLPLLSVEKRLKLPSNLRCSVPGAQSQAINLYTF